MTSIATPDEIAAMARADALRHLDSLLEAGPGFPFCLHCGAEMPGHTDPAIGMNGIAARHFRAPDHSAGCAYAAAMQFRWIPAGELMLEDKPPDVVDNGDGTYQITWRFHRRQTPRRDSGATP